MWIYETKTVEEKWAVGVVCDRCRRHITDDIEMQEVCVLNFVGGYGSVFGDGSRIECDICQQCLKELIGDFCRYRDTQ